MLLIGIDVGGTFTDLVAYDSKTKSFNVVKIPTTPQPEKGVITSLASTRVRRDQVTLIYHATTIATNALLTRQSLTRTALITNHGFRDVLEIGRQRRPELYNLKTRRPTPLVERKDRYTVGGRILWNGSEREPLAEKDLRKTATKIIRAGYHSVAVSFLNSYINPRHEIRARQVLVKSGFKGSIHLSSEVNPEYREYERTSTTVVNAVLTNPVGKYLGRLQKAIRAAGFQCPFYVMKSDGSATTLPHATRRPISLIESGPAAGVLACQALARTLGLSNVITFDMGGTTAKASALTNQRFDISSEFEAAAKTYHGRSLRGSGYPVRQPFIDLAEVSSGGGTIAWIDETGTLKLGPESAGSSPGPAAYGKGGRKPTVTDANIVSGRISPRQILGGHLTLNRELALRSVKEISRKIGASVSETALNVLRLANHNMTKALSLVSVERGRDPRDFTIVAFGGAGPLHACEIAMELGIKRVLVPLHPGLFSAVGLITAELSRTFSQSVMMPASTSLESFFKQLRKRARDSLEQEKITDYSTVEHVDLRYRGQGYELTLPYRKEANLDKLYALHHKRLYGYSSRDLVEAVNVRLRATIHTPKMAFSKVRVDPVKARAHSERRVMLPDGKNGLTKVYERAGLSPGAHGMGPCVIEEYDSTTMVDGNWDWRIDQYQNIDITLRH